jgi:DNA-directed RNA polymerase subunit M/transcription elongation factor TFIIS
MKEVATSSRIPERQPWIVRALTRRCRRCAGHGETWSEVRADGHGSERRTVFLECRKCGATGREPGRLLRALGEYLARVYGE